MSDCQIVICQPCVPAYRVGLFEGLGRIYGSRLRVVAGPFFDKGVPSSPLRGVQTDYSHPVAELGVIRLQRGLSLRGLNSHDSVVVICGEPRNLSMMRLAIWARVRGFGPLVGTPQDRDVEAVANCRPSLFDADSGERYPVLYAGGGALDGGAGL